MKRNAPYFFALFFYGMVCLSLPAVADESTQTLVQKVRFTEADDATCMVNEGKLISLILDDPTLKLEVWVDRWFMDVQTADHTKQTLSSENPVVDLGCSQTKAGSQHWTIHSVRHYKDES